MDIASLSMALSSFQTAQNTSLAVLKNCMEQNSENLLKIIEEGINISDISFEQGSIDILI